jgi:hypothetical protein
LPALVPHVPSTSGVALLRGALLRGALLRGALSGCEVEGEAGTGQ